MSKRGHGMSGDDGAEGRAPNQRSFSLKSDEAHEALCPRDERPWIPNGALPREPRTWGRRVIVEGSQSGGPASTAAKLRERRRALRR